MVYKHTIPQINAYRKLQFHVVMNENVIHFTKGFALFVSPIVFMSLNITNKRTIHKTPVFNSVIFNFGL